MRRLIVLAVLGGVLVLPGASPAKLGPEASTVGMALGKICSDDCFCYPDACAFTNFRISFDLRGTLAVQGARWAGMISFSTTGHLSPPTGSLFGAGRDGTLSPFTLNERGFDGTVLTGSCSGSGGSADSPGGGISTGMPNYVKLKCSVRIGSSAPQVIRLHIVFTILTEESCSCPQASRLQGVYSGLKIPTVAL